jgi:hypothetical protein
MLGGAAFLGYRIYRVVVISRNASPRLAWQTLTGALMIAVFGGASFVIVEWYRSNQIEQRLVQFEKKLTDHVSGGDLDKAIILAGQLFSYSGARKDEALYEKLVLVRDIVRRPWTYRTKPGMSASLARLTISQKYYVDVEGRRDTDLLIAAGFLGWQGGGDRYTEYWTANAFAHALQIEPAVGETTLLRPYAVYYLTAYLTNPLPDHLIKQLLESKGVPSNEVFGPVTDPTTSLTDLYVEQRYSSDQLKQILAKANPDSAEIGGSYNAFTVGVRAAEAYRTIVPNYVEMVRLTAEAGVAADEGSRQVWSEQIRTTSRAITEAFERYIHYLQNEAPAADPLRLNTFKGLWPIYDHAVSAARTAKAPDSQTDTSAPEPIFRRWLEEVVRPVSKPRSFKLFKALVEADYQRSDALLQQFERATIDLLDEERKNVAEYCGNSFCNLIFIQSPSQGIVEHASTELGLFGCWTDANPPPFGGAVDCEHGSAGGSRTWAVPAAMLFRSSFYFNPMDYEIDSEWAKAVLSNRVIPIF